MRIFTLADDLTGAAEVANCFLTETNKVRVGFESEGCWDFTLNSNVVQVYDSETRSMTKSQAEETVGRGAKELLSYGSPFRLFKKIDSTMRGHVGAEVSSLLTTLKRQIAILTPANPTSGRTVRDGLLYVNNTQIAQTNYANDPIHPITSSRIADLIEASPEIKLFELKLALIRKGAEAVRTELNKLHKSFSIVIADTETEEDLACLAGLVNENPDYIPVGTAGFAQELSKRWLKEEKRQHVNQFLSCRRILVVLGTANPRTKIQLQELAKQIPAHMICVHPVRLADPLLRDEEISRVLEEIKNSSSVTVLYSDSERPQFLNKLDDEPKHLDFVSDIAVAAKSWYLETVENYPGPIGIIASGGEMALAVCRCLCADAIWPMGDIQSLLPCSFIHGLPAETYLISKGGGVGDTDALLKAAQFLTSRVIGDEKSNV